MVSSSRPIEAVQGAPCRVSGSLADSSAIGDERLGQGFDCLRRLCLRWFDHQRFLNDQGEVDRWWMEAVVDQAFGDVVGADIVLTLLPRAGKHDFMQDWPVVREIVVSVQQDAQIVRIQDSLDRRPIVVRPIPALAYRHTLAGGHRRCRGTVVGVRCFAPALRGGRVRHRLPRGSAWVDMGPVPLCSRPARLRGRRRRAEC